MLDRTYPRLLAGVGLLCIALTGCDNLAPGPTRSVSDRPADSSSTLLPGTTVANVRAMATQVLKEHFRIDPENSTAVMLRSQSAETTAHADNETPRMNEVLSGRSGRRRQMAEIVLVERGADVVVRCRVQVQRRETAERAAFAPQRSGEDRPAEMTAAERGETIQTRTRDQWVNVGRDRQLERTMLDQIAERAERAAVAPATRPQG